MMFELVDVAISCAFAFAWGWTSRRLRRVSDELSESRRAYLDLAAANAKKSAEIERLNQRLRMENEWRKESDREAATALALADKRAAEIVSLNHDKAVLEANLKRHLGGNASKRPGGLASSRAMERNASGNFIGRKMA